MDQSFRCNQLFQKVDNTSQDCDPWKKGNKWAKPCDLLFLCGGIYQIPVQRGNTEYGGGLLQSCGDKVQSWRRLRHLKFAVQSTWEKEGTQNEVQKSAEGSICIFGSRLSYVFIVWLSMGQAKHHQGENSYKGPISWTTIKILTELGDPQDLNYSGAV